MPEVGGLKGMNKILVVTWDDRIVGPVLAHILSLEFGMSTVRMEVESVGDRKVEEDSPLSPYWSWLASQMEVDLNSHQQRRLEDVNADDFQATLSLSGETLIKVVKNAGWSTKTIWTLNLTVAEPNPEDYELCKRALINACGQFVFKL